MRPDIVAVVATLAVVTACGGSSTATPTASGRPTGGSSAPPSNSSPVHGMPPQVGGAGDWLMYGRSGSRSGVGPAAPALSPGAVHIAWTSDALDGDVFAEPLVDSGRVVVATEGGSLYGLDLQSGRVLWTRHVADPATDVMPCGSIQPLGITGTPAIDPAMHLVYAVTERSDGSHLLAAVDDGTGAVRWQRVVDPPGMIPANQQQRAATVIANGHVYVAFGGLLGDCAVYHGWVIGVALDRQGPLLDYRLPTTNKGGIWATSGIAVGDDGSLYVASGNGVSQGAYDHSESLVRLDPSLHEMGFAAPTDWSFDNSHDLDIGSTGPLLLPGGLIAVGAKDAKLHVSDASHLGGVGGELADTQVCGRNGGIFGGMAASGRRVFAPCNDGLVAVDVDARGHATVAWTGPPLRPPALAYGAVWAVDLLSTDTLRAFDPSSGHELASVKIGTTRNFMTPSAVSGFLLVGAERHVAAVAVD